MQEPKKLKLGLKDLSPLFSNPSDGSRPVSDALPVFNGLSLCHVHAPESREASCRMAASLVSLTRKRHHDAHLWAIEAEPFIEKLLAPSSGSLRTLTLDRFESICRTNSPDIRFSPSLLFLDFDVRHPFHIKKIVPLLDRTILVVQAETESLIETYRWIKITAALNPRMDFRVLFGGAGENQGERLFECLSEMVSQRLGISLGWLGNVAPSPWEEPSRLDWDVLLSLGGLATREKKSLAAFLTSYGRD